MKKSIIIAFTVGAVTFGSVGVFAGQYVATDNSFPININGKMVHPEGYNINGSTYFKLRDIAKIVGFDVDFVDNTIMLSTETAATPEPEQATNSIHHSDDNYLDSKDIEFLKQCCTRIPTFNSSDITSSKFATDFVINYYTGARSGVTKGEYRCYLEDNVRNTYKMLFGADMPSDVDVKSEALPSGDMYYLLKPETLNTDLYFVFDIKTTSTGYTVRFVQDPGDNMKVFTIEKADNDNGFIITSITDVK